MSRLTMLHINIIGAVLALIFGAVLYFTVITGATDEQQKADVAYKGTKTTADTLPKAKADLTKANKDKITAETAYAIYEKQYMPVIGYTGDRLTTMMRVFWPNNGRSWPERYRKTMKNWMSGERKRYGIDWDNPTVTAMGPYGPNPNSIDAGQQGEGLGENGLHYRYSMAIRAKTIQSIERHFANWPRVRMAGVPVASNLQITGNSPNLSATYDLTMTLILHEKIPPADGRLGGGSGGAAGGGSPGGGGKGGAFGGGSFGAGQTPGGSGGGPPAGGSGGGGKPAAGGAMGAF